MLSRLTMVLVLAGLAMAPVRALASSHLELDAELVSWSGPAGTMVIRVVASSDVLWSGHLVAGVGSVSVFEDVELPAGTEKAWDVLVPAPGQASRVRVTLVDPEAKESTRVLIDLPTAEDGPQVVAVGASAELLAALRDARTAPVGNAPVVTEAVAWDGQLVDAFDYVVLGTPLEGSDLDGARAWVRGGGRIVGIPATTAGLAEDGAGSRWGEITVAGLGRGEVVTVAADRVASPTAWGLALRDIGGTSLAAGIEQQFGDPYRALGEAAAGSGNALALIPWLLAAMGVYIVVAGPANLLLLRRLGRPELGWVAIPVIAFLGVAGLWYFGPRESTVVARHATVISDDAEFIGVSLVASNDGRREIGLVGPRVLAAVSDATFDIGPVGDEALDIDFKTGRSLTLFAQRATAGGSLEVSSDGEAVTIVNGTGVALEQWGVALGSMVLGSNGTLEPGASDVLVIDGFISEDPWEPLLVQKLWEDPVITRGDLVWRAYRPLLGAGEAFVEGVRVDSFAWGLTSQRRQDISVDGDVESMDGLTLYLTRVDVPPRQVEQARGRVLATDGLRQEGPFWLWGFGSVVLEYTADPAGGDLQLNDRSGGFGRTLTYSVFDPARGDWIEVGDTGTAFQAASLVTPTGLVYLRIETNEDREIDLQSLVLEASR